MRKKKPRLKSRCPQCGFLMNAIAGKKDAICVNCGYKEPCC